MRYALPVLLLASPAFADMTLSLPSAADGHFQPAQVLSGFGCSGQNRSPELAWSGAPPETKSFIVSLFGPDARTGSGLWHWSAFNIPAAVTELAEGAAGAMPVGTVAARNDFSHNSYDGACPPEGSTHHYVVTVFAMPAANLPLDQTASGAMMGFFRQHRVACPRQRHRHLWALSHAGLAQHACPRPEGPAAEEVAGAYDGTDRDRPSPDRSGV